MNTKGDGNRKPTAGDTATKGLGTSKAVLSTLKLVGEEDELAFLKAAADAANGILSGIRVRVHDLVFEQNNQKLTGAYCIGYRRRRDRRRFCGPRYGRLWAGVHRDHLMRGYLKPPWRNTRPNQGGFWGTYEVNRGSSPTPYLLISRHS